jgi:imidazolonepropionase-like amidohydrolase
VRGKEWRAEAVERIKDPGLALVPASVRESWTENSKHPSDSVGYEKIAEFLKKYAEAGGKIIPGTDAGGNGTIAGLTLHYEMQMLVDLGVPPMKAIQGATLWGAESIGQADDLGSIQAGKLADIIVIEGNPLEDIAMTRNVGMVMRDGTVLDTTYDPGFVNPIPRPSYPSP